MFHKFVRAASMWTVGALLWACAGSTAAVVVGQVDTFEDGTSMGWFFGGGPVGIPPTPWVNVPTGGPAGTSDNFLQISANGGAGPLSRLSALNVFQWAGNYTSAGVGAVRMDVNNFGPDDLDLRLFFEDLSPGFGPPVNQALSGAVHVPALSGWTTIEFPISAADLLPVLGSAADALMNTDLLRIVHNPLDTVPPPPTSLPVVTAILGVDNIQALNAVDEPGAMSLLLSAFIGLLLVLRGRPRDAVAAAALGAVERVVGYAHQLFPRRRLAGLHGGEAEAHRDRQLAGVGGHGG